MLSIVFAMAFIAISFNGRQADLDMFVRGMALTGGASEAFRKKFGHLMPEGESGPDGG